MEYWSAHLLLAVLLLIPWQSRKGIRLLDELVVNHPGARLAFYRDAIIGQWVLAGIAFAILWYHDPDYVRSLTGVAIDSDGLLVVGLAALALLSQSPLVPAARRRMARSRSTHRLLLPIINILPHNDDERRMWVHVAVTAGICEEVLFRAFLFFYATSVLEIGVAGAIALSSAVFAFGHSYQGTANMFRVGVAGAILGCTFAATDTLVYCVVLHALLDLGALRMRELLPPEETRRDEVNES